MLLGKSVDKTSSGNAKENPPLLALPPARQYMHNAYAAIRTLNAQTGRMVWTYLWKKFARPQGSEASRKTLERAERRAREKHEKSKASRGSHALPLTLCTESG